MNVSKLPNPFGRCSTCPLLFQRRSRGGLSNTLMYNTFGQFVVISFHKPLSPLLWKKDGTMLLELATYGQSYINNGKPPPTSPCGVGYPADGRSGSIPTGRAVEGRP